MSRNVLFLLFVIETCFALKCYTSNFKEKKIIPGYTLQECDIYINEIRKLQKKSQGKPNFQMSCFTSWITKGGNEAVVKGCFPKNSCDKLEGILEDKSAGAVRCVQCDDDGCNSTGVATQITFLLFVGCILLHQV